MLREFVQMVESGDKTPQDLLQICLRRIAELDPSIHAWVQVAPRPGDPHGLLRGIPYGLKDIFETRGMSTAYGSPLYAGRQGDRDAAIIDELAHSGAVLAGKTETSAFASFDPAPTVNPRLPGHTPGGSSAGSAAAVAARMVPFSVGSQTLGSVLRPASYCGVCGFKPSFGLLSTAGMLPFAPSLDTVGLFTETARDMALLWSRAFDGRLDLEFRRPLYIRVAADPVMTTALDDAVERLRAAGIAITEIGPPEKWDELVEAAYSINAYEGARSHAARFEQFGDAIGKRLAQLIRRGLAMPVEEYESAQRLVSRMRTEVAALFWEHPAIITAAATGPAPEAASGTGDPRNNAAWTALGLPAVSVPLPRAPLPVGIQIVGAWGRDDAVVSVAADAEKLLLA